MASVFVDRSACTRRTLFPGVEIFTAAAEHMMLSQVEFQPGAVVEAHSYPHEQVGMVVEKPLVDVRHHTVPRARTGLAE